MKKLFLTGITAITLLSIIGSGTVLYQNKHSTSDMGGSVGISPIHAAYAALPKQAQRLYYKQSEGLTKEVPVRLVELDQLTIGCFAPEGVMQMSEYDSNLGGQCCGTLKDMEAYDEQLVALETFIAQHGNLDLIPKDPYDVPVAEAQQLIVLDTNVTLSIEQQEVYSRALTLSHHGGPCCCRCWKWYMMSGLAKNLIVDYRWNAEEIAQLWDLSSSCGHDEDTNYQKHYSDTKDHHE